MALLFEGRNKAYRAHRCLSGQEKNGEVLCQPAGQASNMSGLAGRGGEIMAAQVAPPTIASSLGAPVPSELKKAESQEWYYPLKIAPFPSVPFTHHLRAGGVCQIMGSHSSFGVASSGRLYVRARGLAPRCLLDQLKASFLHSNSKACAPRPRTALVPAPSLRSDLWGHPGSSKGLPSHLGPAPWHTHRRL